MTVPERRWWELPPGVLTKLATKLADPSVRPKSTSFYSGTVPKVAGAGTVLPNKTFDASRAWQTTFRPPVRPEEVIVDVVNNTVIQPQGEFVPSYYFYEEYILTAVGLWQSFITGVKANEYTAAGTAIGVCALLSLYMRSSNAQRIRSNHEVVRSNAEVLQSNAALQQRLHEHDHRNKPVETSECSTLNAAILARLRQELKTKAVNENRLQSELNQAKRDLSAKNKTINSRDDAIASKEKALNKSDEELNTTKKNLESSDKTVKNQSEELNSLKKKSTEKNKTIEDQKRDLASYENTVKDLRGQLTAKDDAFAKQSGELNSMKSDIQAKDRDLEAKDNTIAEQKRALETSDEAMKTIRRELSTQIKDNTGMQKEIDNLKADKSTNEATIKAKDKTIADQKGALESGDKAMKTIRKELGTQIKDNTAMQKEIDSLKADKSTKEATIKLCNTTLEAQNRDLESKADAEKKIRDELATSVKSEADLQKEVDSLKADKSAKDATIKHLKTTVEIQERHLNANAEAEKKIREKLDAKSESNEHLQKEVESLTAEKIANEATIKRHKLEIEAMNHEIQSKVDKAVEEALLAAKGKSNLDGKPPSFSGSGPPKSVTDGAVGNFAEPAKGAVEEISNSQVHTIDPVDASQDTDPVALVPRQEEGLHSNSGYSADEKPSTDMGPKDKDTRTSKDAPPRLEEGSMSQPSSTAGHSAFNTSPPSSGTDHEHSSGKTQPKDDSPKLTPGTADMNELIGGQITNTLPETITTKNDTDQPTPEKNDVDPVQDLHQGKETPDTGAPPKKRGLRGRPLSHDLRKSIFREAAANAKTVHGASCFINDSYSALAHMTENFNGLQLREVVEQASIVAMEVAATQPGSPAIITPKHLNNAVIKIATQYDLHVTNADQGLGQNEEDSKPRPRKPMSFDERRGYLQSYRLRSAPREDNIVWDQIANLTEGFRADDIKKLIVEAFSDANSKLRTKISQHDLESVISEMKTGGMIRNQGIDDDEEHVSSNPPSNQNGPPTSNGNGLPPRPDLRLPPKPPSNQTPNQPTNSETQNYNGLPPNTPTGPRADSNTNANTNSQPSTRPHRKRGRGKADKSDNKPSLPDWL